VTIPDTAAEAIALQRVLATRVVRRGRPRLRRVVGTDCAFSDDGRICLAAAVVWSIPDRAVLESSTASAPCTFPYIPGLLSFRELPAVLAALECITTPFDAVLCDGQGIAHPRRFGLACHVGVAIDRPAVGCAKSRLIGTYAEPGQRRGAVSPLFDRDEIVGTVVRTRRAVTPVYVSVGHRVDLERAVALVLACDEGFRIPAPTRRADKLVGAVAHGGRG